MTQLRQSALTYKRSRGIWVLATKDEFIEIGDKFREECHKNMITSAKSAAKIFNYLRHTRQLPVFFIREKYDYLLLNYLSAYVENKKEDVEDAALDLLNAIVEDIDELKGDYDD